MSLYRTDGKHGTKLINRAIEDLEGLDIGEDIQAYIAPQTQDDSTASDVAGVVVDLNALLAKLRTAGILTA